MGEQLIAYYAVCLAGGMFIGWNVRSPVNVLALCFLWASLVYLAGWSLGIVQ